jgi:hypothetical protein
MAWPVAEPTLVADGWTPEGAPVSVAGAIAAPTADLADATAVVPTTPPGDGAHGEPGEGGEPPVVVERRRAPRRRADREAGKTPASADAAAPRPAARAGSGSARASDE